MEKREKEGKKRRKAEKKGQRGKDGDKREKGVIMFRKKNRGKNQSQLLGMGKKINNRVKYIPLFGILYSLTLLGCQEYIKPPCPCRLSGVH